MAAASLQKTPKPDSGSENADLLIAWREIISPSIATLRGMAGTTEDEFLQIGSQLQGFYQRSSEITSMANRLVDTVSGESLQSLVERLRGMMADTEAYLAAARWNWKRGQYAASASRSGFGLLSLLLAGPSLLSGAYWKAVRDEHVPFSAGRVLQGLVS